MLSGSGSQPRGGPLRWPLPALLAWGAGWLLLHAVPPGPLPGWSILLLAWTPSLALALWVAGPWKRLMAVVGLPLALWLHQGATSWPSWVWLLPVAAILASYPLSAWRDAPLFPTPADALVGLAPALDLPARPRVLDAGSGLGHGLSALRRAFPQARLEGVERSMLLVLLARLRVEPGAHLRCGDMWSTDWSLHDLVYLFQRPESMAGAWRKACAEMRAGSWLVSLEFAIPDIDAEHVVETSGSRQRRVYAYRIPDRGSDPAQSRAPAADKMEPEACS